jgi:hypothetical protein
MNSSTHWNIINLLGKRQVTAVSRSSSRRCWKEGQGARERAREMQAEAAAGVKGMGMVQPDTDQTAWIAVPA